MKKIKIYKENGKFVIERVNQFNHSWKRFFITENGLKEGLLSYERVLDEYEIEASGEVFAVIVNSLNKRAAELMNKKKSTTEEQIEALYLANGLSDFKLRSVEDIQKVHGIDCRNIAGYEDLDDLEKKNYERFILKFFNAWGIEARVYIEPQAIYQVEHIDYVVQQEDGTFIIAAGEIFSIDRNGLRIKIHEWEDERYKDSKRIAKEPKKYLKFEYKYRGRKEWLHVIKNGLEWY